MSTPGPGAALTETPKSPSPQDDREGTHSLTDSITDYPVHDGRRYHKYKEGSYLFPNDDLESDRLDFQYQLLAMLHGGKIFFAPLRKPKRILDVGTGTGMWPIDMASHFPEATIIGTDLSPIQPTAVPPNVHFYIDDATERDWLYKPDELFDYIHIRSMIGSVPSFKGVMQTSYANLQPSGWLECQEWQIDLFCDDESLDRTKDYPLRDWIKYFLNANNKLDKPRAVRYAPKIASWMREIGFVDIHERIDKVPINGWSRDPHLQKVGKWQQSNWLQGLGGFSYAHFGPRGLGWTKPEIEVFLVGVRNAIQNKNVRVYQKFYSVYGRRPGPGEAKPKAIPGSVPEKERKGKEKRR